MRAARSGAAIGGAQVVGYGLSFLLGIVIAANFGTSRATDAYFMATSTAELVAKLLLGGALSSVFLPLFVEFLGSGDRPRAWRLFTGLLLLALTAFVVLGTTLELFTAPLIRFLAPGFSDETQGMTILLLRIVVPAYLLSFLADLVIVPLHGHGRFGLPGVSRLLPPLSMLAILMLFARQLGVVALAIGLVAGTALQLILLLGGLRRSGFRPNLPRPLWNADLRQVVRLTLPFVVSILAAHGAGIVYRILVSHQPEGSFASLKFAEKIFQMANLLFLGTITQVAFPSFARAVASGSDEETLNRLTIAIRVVAFFAIPLTIGVVILREPLIRLLFERGAFTADASRATASLVPLYMVGLLGNGVSSLLGHLALALKASWLTVKVNVALQAIAATFFLLLVPRLGVSGLALVSGFGPFVLTALYLWVLRTRYPRIGRGVIGAIRDYRFWVPAITCAFLTLVSRSLAEVFRPETMTGSAVTVVAGAALGGAGYLLTAWLLRTPEVETIRALARHLVKRLSS